MASQSVTETENTTGQAEAHETEDAATGDEAQNAPETPDDETPDTATKDTAKAEAGEGDTATTSSTTSQDATPATATAGGTAEQPAAGSGSGFAAGAVALVSAGLGLSSVTGASLGDMMRAREELLGQIAAASGGQVDQIGVLYSSPWHTVALVNAVVAVLAIAVGGVLLALRGRRPETPSWVKAVALGGVLLGVVGFVVSGGMYLDLFAAPPVLPSMPGFGG